MVSGDCSCPRNRGVVTIRCGLSDNVLLNRDALLNMNSDTLSKEQRSQLMSRVRHKSTKPELVVRSLLHSLGFRFRLHPRNLPGTPDVVLPKYRTVIFVHGCFWHRHPNCKKTTTPKQNADFWIEKFERNMARDEHKVRELETMGWRVIIIWECETCDEKQLMSSLPVILKGEMPVSRNCP